MGIEISQKKLILIVIVIFAALIPIVFLIEYLDESVINPRIWSDWSCEEMREFALRFEDEKLTDFQRAQFHEDLSHCLGS